VEYILEPSSFKKTALSLGKTSYTSMRADIIVEMDMKKKPVRALQLSREVYSPVN